MESFEHDGVWWVAEDPDCRWTGTVRFEPRDGATLSVILPGGRSDHGAPPETSAVIVGVTTAGKAVSLLDCFTVSVSAPMPVTRRIDIFANGVIVGFHCDRTDPLVATASATFDHLTAWWGRSGVEWTSTTDAPGLAVRYAAPPRLVVYEADPWTIAIEVGASRAPGDHLIALRETARFVVNATAPRPLSEFRQWMQACGDFLSIVCATLCNVESFTVVPSRAPEAIERPGTFHASPLYENRDRGAWSVIGNALVRVDDLEGRVPAILGAWLAQARKLLPVRVLYLLGVYGGGFVETKLLSLTQAAEAFYRRSAAEPKRSQRRMWEALFAEHGEALRVLVAEPATYLEPIRTHRNAFTHFEPEAEPTSSPEDVLRYTFVLRLLLEACFLSAAGFSSEEIAALAHRSGRYRRLARRFFTAPEGGVALS